MNPIHERALQAASRFHRAEAGLLTILEEVEESGTFMEFGCTSLFNYCVQELKLSESVASNLVTVMRAAKEFPALKAAIESERLSVSKARKITPVLTKEDPEK